MFFCCKKAGSRGKSRRKRKTNPNENFNGFMGRFTNKWDKNRRKDGLRAANDKKNNCAPGANNSFVLQRRFFVGIISL